MIGPGTVLDGRYRLDRPLARGGFATVYLATHLRLGHTVAVKVLDPALLANEDEREFLARFEREAALVARLDHPNILGVHDFGEAEGTAYIIMPYADGGSLADLLRRAHGTGMPETRQALSFMAQAAEALDYAHARGIVHRDVKPQNMLLRAGTGRLLLADFGIAKVLRETAGLSRTSVTGTLAYMAPEQLQGRVGPGVDIYALGCVAFQLLTGAVPYPGSAEQVMWGHAWGEIPQIAERGGAHLAPAVQAAIERALAKRPEDRFASAGALAQAFAGALEARPDVSDAPTVVQGNTPPRPTDAPTALIPGSGARGEGPRASAALTEQQAGTGPSVAAVPTVHGAGAGAGASTASAEAREDARMPASAQSPALPPWPQATPPSAHNANPVRVAPVPPPPARSAAESAPVRNWRLPVFLILGVVVIGLIFFGNRALEARDRDASAAASTETEVARVLLVQSGATATAMAATAEAVGVAARQDTATAVARQQAATGTAGVAASATAQAVATGTAQAAATGTVRANATATQQAQAQAQATADAWATGSRIVFGPDTGAIAHTPGDGVAQIRSTGVNLRDFIAEARVTNPYPTTQGNWSFGIGFRNVDRQGEYRLTIQSNRVWAISFFGSTAQEYQVIVQGTLDNLNTSENGQNSVTLFVRSDRALFFVNGLYIASFSVNARMESGNVWLGQALFANEEIAGATTNYADFIVRALR